MKRIPRHAAAIFSCAACAMLGLGARPACPADAPGPPKLTIAYDDNRHGGRVKNSAGFSCAVQGSEKTVLFDTGEDGRLLLANLRSLGISAKEIDAVVISHSHRDHAGGLRYLLSQNRRILAYLPATHSGSLMKEVEQQGGRAIGVGRPLQICAEIFSTGELGTSPPEQSLVIRTPGGLVVVTGCAHTGILRVIQMAKRQFGGDILLVLGGFHLADSNKNEIEQVIAGMKSLAVRHVAPCHCTGERARELFRKAYGAKFIEAGAGRVIDIEGLR